MSISVTSLRRLLLDHHRLALWLALAALTVRLLVPAGFMVGQVDGRAMLQICSGFGPVSVAPVTDHGAMPMTGHAAATAKHHGGGHDDAGGHAAVDMPCAYAALAHGAVAAADIVLLAFAIAFVMALGFAARAVRPLRSRAYLRPPLRGPPLLA